MLYWLCVIMKHALLIVKYQKRNGTIYVFLLTENYFTSLYAECNAFTHFVLCNDPCSNPSFQAFNLVVKYPTNHISHSCMLWVWFVKKSSSFNHVLSWILSTIPKPFPSVELAGVLKYGLLFCVLSWHNEYCFVQIHIWNVIPLTLITSPTFRMVPITRYKSGILCLYKHW